MPDDPRLRTLLERREAMRQRGETVCLEALCETCPELLPALRRQIEQGESQPSVPGTLDLPAVSSAEAVPGTIAGDPVELPGETQRLLAGAEAACPVQVPGYQILNELGRGGMGVVYKARHLKLNRIVALKMVLAGAHAGPQQLARFQVEAESVASLHHANIVQVYEVGEHGHCPYLALEFVEGGGLDRKLAGQRLPPREAAHLAEQLARAMHVAHLRGIIHRDLKPANVLLAQDGTPKITDFGLAKKLNEENSQTHSGSVLGTPSYMAPEQALGKVREIGPHSDVYSLGAILYECLTGRPPFQGDSVMQTLALVQTEEVAPPSQVMKSPLPRDLETICVKCLHKNPGRRYASAEELADDLKRFLNQEPIAARPVGRLERLGMWARRRPAVAGLLGVSVAAAVALAGLGLWSHVKVRAALGRAETSLKKAREAVNSFYVQFAEEWLDDAVDMEEQQKESLKEALRHYGELAREEGRDPDLRRGQGQALMRMGQIYRKFGEQDKAGEAFEQAAAIQQGLVEQFPGEPRYRQDLANTHNWWGELHRVSGRLADARRNYEAAMALQEQLVQQDGNEPSYRHELARSHYNRALVRERTADPDGAREDHDRAIELLAEAVREQPRLPGPQLDLARAYLNLGGLLRGARKYPDAQAAYGKAIGRLDALARQYPRKTEYRFELAKAYKNLGNLEEGSLKQFPRAEAAHQAARKLLDRLADDFPTLPHYKQERALACLGLGAAQYRQTRYPEAGQNWELAARLLQELAQEWPRNESYQRESGLARYNLGLLHLRAHKKPAQAVPHLSESEKHFRAALALNPGAAESHAALRLTLRLLADANLQCGEVRLAARAARDAAGTGAGERERYQAAVLLGRCASAIEQDPSAGTAEERKRLAAEFAGQAMQALLSANPLQFRESLLSDRTGAFSSLQGRPDFQQLLSRIETAPRP